MIIILKECIIRRITKQPPKFQSNVNVADMISFYNLKYPKGKQLTPTHFIDDPDAIDLSKLDPMDTLAPIRLNLVRL